MLKIVGIAVGCLILSGCIGTLTKANVVVENVTESEQFAKLCKARPIVMSLYTLVKRDVQIPANIDEKVRTANASIESICVNKPTNIVAALFEIQRQLDIITDATGSVSAGATAAVVSN